MYLFLDHLAEITDIQSKARLSIKHLSSNQLYDVSYNEILPASLTNGKFIPKSDACQLPDLNIANILKNLKSRYEKDEIYTFIANILVAVNPFGQSDISGHGTYSQANQLLYYNKSLGQMPPHVYSIAENAIKNLVHTNQSQSVLISGESGSGKTETTKFFVNYLISRQEKLNSSVSSTNITYEQIKHINPLLETFGNAKTERNENSSRFGKFLQLNFSSKNKLIKNIEFKTFLFEKSRTNICLNSSSTSKNDLSTRTFHIFYQLLANLKKLPSSWGLSDLNYFKLLGQPSKNLQFLKSEIVNDKDNFKSTMKTLKYVGIDYLKLLKILAGLLHLSNFEFAEILDGNGKVGLAQSCEISFEKVVHLLVEMGGNQLIIPSQAH